MLLPEVNNTTALRQEYSDESIWRVFNFFTWSCKIFKWSISIIIWSEEWNPVATNKEPTWSGNSFWATLRTKSSLQTHFSNDIWSVMCNSGKKGILRAHSTAEKRRRAASSQIFSMHTNWLGMEHCKAKQDIGCGSARRNNAISREDSTLFEMYCVVCSGVDCKRPRCTATKK